MARSPIFMTSSNTATLFSSRATVCACASLAPNEAPRTTAMATPSAACLNDMAPSMTPAYCAGPT